MAGDPAPGGPVPNAPVPDACAPGLPALDPSTLASGAPAPESSEPSASAAPTPEPSTSGAPTPEPPAFTGPVLGVSAAAEPAPDVAALAAQYLDLLADLPRFHLVGWSFGAVVAHEMAVRAPERVGALVLVDPAFPGDHDPDDLDASAALRAELGEAAESELLPVLESNVRAHAAHRPGRYRGAAVFVQGEENRAHGTAARWADVVDGPFRAHDVPAGHFDLVRRPHVDALAALVRDALGTAR